MRRARTIALMVAGLMVATTLAASAADLDPSWGTGGVATFGVPAGATLEDSALLPDGRLVVVGTMAAHEPWGLIVADDGSSATPLAGLTPAPLSFSAVTIGNSRIYAVGTIEIGLGISAIVAIFDFDGALLGSGTFAINEYTEPTSVVTDAAGRVFVAGTGRGDDDGSETAWVVRLRADGTADAGFPTLFLEAPDAGTTNPRAYVGATAGRAVAVAVGDDGAGPPGSSIGFHRITETGSVFMADFSSARTITDADLDSTSGTAVFGSITPGSTAAEVNYLIHSIDQTGVPEGTSVGNWPGSVDRVEVGRLRTGDLLGAFESGANTVVDQVESADVFATRPITELGDVTTSPVDGAVFVSTKDLSPDTITVARYEGDTSGRFLDDDGSVHETDIEEMEALGITRGCNPPLNDRFCPEDNVTRGQMAAFLRRALDLPASSTDFFIDDNGSIFETDINAIAEAGITLGCNPPANDRYCPTSLVSRGQMAAFLRRSYSLPASATDFFVDDDSSIFEADINAIAEVGITLGCNPPANDHYCPNASVTREQMASFLVRASRL
ncbi:MAG: hypothetical protein U9N79_00500 [Actinomycetota bacterium]|nr:hypothetical protein [Actinomycetota bacterium]